MCKPYDHHFCRLPLYILNVIYLQFAIKESTNFDTLITLLYLDVCLGFWFLWTQRSFHVSCPLLLTDTKTKDY